MRARVERTALLVLLMSTLLESAATPLNDAPFTLTPPPALAPAPVARAASGNTYAWLPADLAEPERLMITAMPVSEVHARLGALSEAQCLRLFLDALRREYARFFAVEQGTPLVLGPARLTRVRWTGAKGGRGLTGVLACGALGANYYVVHYVDAVTRAPRSFAAIRAALASFAPAP